MTERTKTAMGTQITTLLADNTAGDISAADMRSVEQDQVDSAYFLLTNTATDVVFTPGSAHYTSAVDTNTAILDMDTEINEAYTANTGITLSNGAYLRTDTTTAHTGLIQAYNTGGSSYTTLATLTNGAAPTLNFPITSVTVNANPLVGTTATSVTDHTLVRQDGTNGQAHEETGIVVDDSDNISVCGSITPKNGSALRTTTTAANTLLLQAYDTDTGPAYVTFATLTAGTAPSLAFTIPAGGATGSMDGYVIGGSAAAAGTFTNATATGYFLRSVGNALTAAGTTRADALQLAKEVNNITTAAGSTGVILPVGVIGMRVTIFNAGASVIKVYGSGSDTIDTVAGSTGVSLTNAKRCDYFFVAANTWISSQLGVISA